MAVSPQKIYYWQKIGLLQKNDQYKKSSQLDFLNLLRVRRISEWRDRGISLQQIRKKITSLRAQHGDSDGKRPYLGEKHQGKGTPQVFSVSQTWFRALSLYEPHRQLLTLKNDQLMDCVSGQFYFNFPKSNIDKEGGLEQKVVRFTRKRVEEAQEYSEKRTTNDYIEKANYFRGADPRVIEQVLKLESQLSSSKKEDTRDVASDIDILKRMLKILPQYIPALIELGNIAFEQQDYAQAETIYLRVLSYENRPKELLFNLANLYCRQKKYAVAIRYYRECILLDPEFADSYFNLGIVFIQTGWFERAIESMQAFLRCECSLPADRYYAKRLIASLTQPEENSTSTISHTNHKNPQEEDY